MRIRRLELLAYGPFSGTRLDLGGVPGAVDLVYGPNEAGKSTTLRAIFGLLFGIPLSTKDSYRHAPSELRIGGRIERANGEVFDVVRRKGRKDTLLDRDGRPLDASVLAACLGGLSEDIFSAMFGIDHESLRAGAQAMLEGKGKVGESLFAAGAGATRVHALRKRLLREADELYTPRGRDKRLVSRALADVREAKKKVDDASTTARGYLEQRHGLEQAVADRRQLRERLEALATEQSRLQRWLQVMPHLSRRAELRARLEPLRDAVPLPEDAPERRARAVQKLDEARRARERIAEDLERLETERRELVVLDSLLAVDEAVVKDLDDRRGRHRSAQIDLPKRLDRLGKVEAAMKTALRALGEGLGDADVEKVRLGASRAPAIRRLAGARAALASDSKRLERDAALLDAKREQAATRLATSLGKSRAEAVRAALDRPAELAIPSIDTVLRYADEKKRLAAERAAIADDVARLEERRSGVREELDAGDRAGAVPTEIELAALRERRDAAFAQVRGSVRRGEALAAPSLDEYEADVARCDDVADRLRREADRVAKRAALLAEDAALGARLAALTEKAQAVERAAARSSDDWAALWDAASISPLPPDEMRAWVTRFGELLELEGERRRLEVDLCGAEKALEEWQAEWSESIVAVGIAASSTPEQGMEFLDAAVDLVRKLDECDDLRGRIAAMRRDSEEFARDAEALCRAHLPDAASFPPAEAAHRLVRAHEGARKADEERRRLDAEMAERRRRLEASSAVESDARADVAFLLDAAGVTDLPALEAAERKSAVARDLSAELNRVEARLLELGDGATPEALVEETRGIDVDRARARLEELRGDLDQVTEALQESAAYIARVEAGSSRFGGSRAAEAADEAAAAVSRLKRHVHRYLRVRVASLLLDREIERYRQENQGPIVARAGALLPELTRGRYSGLSVDFGDDDQAVLSAVGPRGPVPIEGLSDGTRDQLYLALRLASLERYLDENEAMPLVLDDILIHSDDDRARAALRVLGDVAGRTQVLFFTHHARLVELAREVLGPGRLVEHALPPPDGRAVDVAFSH